MKTLLIVVLVALCGCKESRNQPPPSGDGWAYKVEDVEFENFLSVERTVYRDREFQNSLDYFGENGWELVTTLALPEVPPGLADKKRVKWRMIFKRPAL